MSDVTPAETTTETTTAPPEGAAPPPKAEEPREKKPVDAAKLDRWRAKLDRQEEAIKRRLDELHTTRRTFETEREQHKREIEEARAARETFERLKSGDLEVLKQALGDDYFDKITRSHLDPEAAAREAKVKEALDLRDKKIADLEKKLNDFFEQQQTERQRAQQAAQDERFLGKVRERDAEELDIFGDGELIGFANHYGGELAQSLGRDPTMDEVIDAILEHEGRPRVGRLRSRQQKGKTEPAAKTAPKAAEGPRTISAADAATPAGAPIPVDDEEARKLALTKMLADRNAEIDRKNRGKSAA